MPSIFYFLLAVAALIVGYTVYGSFVERIFGPDDRQTPVQRLADGVDYVELKPNKIFLIQLLNIAGLGPVFGPILGSLYGPSALIWVVFGSIFAGAVHDYFSGMISIRYDGKSLPDWIGYNLGNPFKLFMRYFAILLLVLVGVVFVAGPAGLLANLTGQNITIFIVVIFGYYFIATVLPIDKIIGRIYPLFAIFLLVMAFGLISVMIIQGYEFYPNGEFVNQHPAGTVMWPLMFITIACGAISGFHATQSPLMARCMTSERQGRPIFYGAMIAEGFIALIWVTIGMSFYNEGFPGIVEKYGEVIKVNNPAIVVNEVSNILLGPVGGFLAVLGVVVLPISTGDTSFRAARLIIADAVGYAQKTPASRLMLAVPMFVIGIVLSFVDFNILWRYFAWVNQSFSVVTLWAIGAYLFHRNKLHWVATIPAMFMTAVCTTYIFFAPIGFGLTQQTSTIIGVGVATVSLAFFLLKAGTPLSHDPLNGKD